MRGTVRARFESKYTVDNESGCWLWTAWIDQNGYGRLSANGRSARAHRVAYELFVGEIPEGLQIDHLCRNRACVNPEHLEPVTPIENVRRGDSYWGRRTHCIHGHPWEGQNLSFIKTRDRLQRRCRICHAQRARRYTAERKMREQVA